MSDDSERSTGRGGALPRDLPDQQANEEPEAPHVQETDAPDEARWPDTDEAGSGPRNTSAEEDDPEAPPPVEPTD